MKAKKILINIIKVFSILNMCLIVPSYIYKVMHTFSFDTILSVLLIVYSIASVDLIYNMFFKNQEVKDSIEIKKANSQNIFYMIISLANGLVICPLLIKYIINIITTEEVDGIIILVTILSVIYIIISEIIMGVLISRVVRLSHEEKEFTQIHKPDKRYDDVESLEPLNKKKKVVTIPVWSTIITILGAILTIIMFIFTK